MNTEELIYRIDGMFVNAVLKGHTLENTGWRVPDCSLDLSYVLAVPYYYLDNTRISNYSDSSRLLNVLDQLKATFMCGEGGTKPKIVAPTDTSFIHIRRTRFEILKEWADERDI